MERRCLVDVLLTKSEATQSIEEVVEMVSRRDRTSWAHGIGADPGRPHDVHPTPSDIEVTVRQCHEPARTSHGGENPVRTAFASWRSSPVSAGSRRSAPVRAGSYHGRDDGFVRSGSNITESSIRARVRTHVGASGAWRTCSTSRGDTGRSQRNRNSRSRRWMTADEGRRRCARS